LSAALTSEARRWRTSGHTQEYASCELERISGDFSRLVKGEMRPCTWKTGERILHNTVRDDVISRQLVEAVTLAGFDGVVNVSSGKFEIPTVVQRKGFRFNVKSFQTIVKDGWTGKSVFVIPIDGQVESVSEIDRLLRAAHEEKADVLIIARVFADDVITTLATNKERGTLNVIPLIADLDLDNVNMLKDVAVVCGVDVISTHKGDLISKISLEDFSTKLDVFVKGDSITFTGDENPYVRIHVEELKERLQSVDENLVGQITKRIRSLQSESVDVMLADPTREILEHVDVALRSLKSLARHGAVRLNSIQNSEIANLLGDEGILGCFSSDVVPMMSVIAPVRYACSAAHVLSNIGAVLEVDRECS
jgi:chaperonin GroEL